jgi:hypothetical protein
MNIQEITPIAEVTPQCKAKSKRSGKQCGNYAVKDRRVCRIHGGLTPKHNPGPKTVEGRQRQHTSNWRHGMRSKAAIEEARQFREFFRQCKQAI